MHSRVFAGREESRSSRGSVVGRLRILTAVVSNHGCSAAASDCNVAGNLADDETDDPKVEFAAGSY